MGAEEVILSLVAVLLGDRKYDKGDRGLMSHVVYGQQHIERCQRGMWLQQDSPRPGGDPCSPRCLRAQAALRIAAHHLGYSDASELLVQLEMPL